MLSLTISNRCFQEGFLLKRFRFKASNTFPSPSIMSFFVKNTANFGDFNDGVLSVDVLAKYSPTLALYSLVFFHFKAYIYYCVKGERKAP